MASRNLLKIIQFNQELKRFADLIQQNANDLAVAVAIETHVEIVTRTPFKTGTARANWNPSVGAPDLSVKPKQSYPEYESTVPTTLIAAATARANAEEIFGPLRGTGNTETLYISNALEYIGALDNGSSKQAPGNFVAEAVAVVEQKLAEGKLDG